MSMLSALKNNDPSVKIADEKDSLGGSGPVDSGSYRAKIGMAYTEKSKGGALGLFVTFLLGPDFKKELRQTLWMTSGDAKGNKTYYADKDGNNQPLPGFSQANAIAMLSTGKEIGDLDTEEKVINLYNYEVKKDVPTKVQAVTELIGQEVVLGVIRQTVDKTKKNDASGEYEPTGETRDENEIDKIFCAREGFENYTTTEVKAKAEAAAFHPEWVKKWEGQVKDKTTKGGATAGAPGKAGAASAGTPKPKQSLFGG